MLEFTDRGIFCREGDFYIDPWRPVARAIITHAHSDHARPGHGTCLAHPLTVPILRLRLGRDLKVQPLGYGSRLRIGKVMVSLHPAGHIPGSAQVRVERGGEVWVVGGDYKLRKDGLSAPWEAVACDAFVTESTFGLPIYKWPDPAEVRREIHDWWHRNREAGKVSLLTAYSLGKAQRLLHMLDRGDGPILIDSSIHRINLAYREAGLQLADFPVLEEVSRKSWPGALIVAPPAAAAAPRFRSLPVSTAHASGWMTVRGNKRRLAVDRGFVLSDHGDWEELNEAVRTSGATRVFVTHGQVDPFARWLRGQGLDARAVRTRFSDEREVAGEPDRRERG